MAEFTIIKKNGKYSHRLNIKKTSKQLDKQRQEILELLSNNPGEAEHMSAWNARLLYNILAKRTKQYLLTTEFMEEEKAKQEEKQNPGQQN